MPRYMTTRKLGNGVISLQWQFWFHFNPDHNKFSSLSNTAEEVIFPVFIDSDVVNAQAWKVLVLKNPIEPP